MLNAYSNKTKSLWLCCFFNNTNKINYLHINKNYSLAYSTSHIDNNSFLLVDIDIIQGNFRALNLR